MFLKFSWNISSFFQGRSFKLTDHWVTKRSPTTVVPNIQMSPRHGCWEGFWQRFPESSGGELSPCRTVWVSLHLPLFSAPLWATCFRGAQHSGWQGNLEAENRANFPESQVMRGERGGDFLDMSSRQLMKCSCRGLHSLLCSGPGDREGSQFPWEILQRFPPHFHRQERLSSHTLEIWARLKWTSVCGYFSNESAQWSPACENCIRSIAP